MARVNRARQDNNVQPNNDDDDDSDDELFGGDEGSELAFAPREVINGVTVINTPNFPIRVRDLLIVVGFTELDAIVLEEREYENFSNFITMTEDNITSTAAQYNRRVRNGQLDELAIDFTGMRTQGVIQIMHWAQDKDRMGINPDTIHYFAVPELRKALANLQVRTARTEQHTTSATNADPGKLTRTTEVFGWFRSFENYIGTFSGTTGIPLNYLVRTEEVDRYDEAGNYLLYEDRGYLEQLRLLAPLEGHVYQQDNATLFNLILGKVTGGPGESYVTQFTRTRDGRAAHRALRHHFMGQGRVNPRLHEASELYERLRYKSERALKFSDFITRMNNMCEMYRDAGDEWNELRKQEFLLNRVSADYLVTDITTIRSNREIHPMSFDAMVSQLQNAVNRHNTSSHSFIGSVNSSHRGGRNGRGRSGGRGRTYSDYRSTYSDSSSRGSSRGGRGSGRHGNSGRSYRGGRNGGRGYSNRSNRNSDNSTTNTTHNESQVFRRIPRAAWNAMSYQQRDVIHQARETARDNADQRSAAAATTQTNHTLNNIMEISRTLQTLDTLRTGGNAGRSDQSVASTITNNNHEETIQRINSIFSGRNSHINNRNRNISRLTTGNYRNVQSISKVERNNIEVEGRMEFDNHADTCVLGKNFVLLNYTGRVCDVYPYSKTYDAIKDIPIVTGATAVQNRETGEVFILVINQGLYFGDQMDHSLINPNQIRHNGLIVNDNPYDKKLELGIHDDEHKLIIPFETQGTIMFANTRTPTQYELENCTHINLTSDSIWDPNNVQLGDHFISSIETNNNSTLQADYERENKSLIMGISAVYDAESFEKNMRAKTFLSKQRHSMVTPEEISDRWQIGLKQAKETLDATTQRYVRSALLPLSRRYRSDRHFYRNHLNHDFSADLYFGRIKSSRGNTAAFIFTNKTGFAVAYPQRGKTSKEGAEALREFTRDFGIPKKLTVDGAQENIGTNSEFMKRVRQYDIDIHISAPRTPRENPAEQTIREIRKKWFRVMGAKHVPKRLWDYGIVWVCEIMQRTTSSSVYANGRTPLEIITGETPDISEYLDFGFYDWVHYRDNAGLGETNLGRFLGVSHRVGNLMSYWILTINGRTVSRTTVQRLTTIELQDREQIGRCKHFDDEIKRIFNDENHIIQVGEDEAQFDWEAFKDDEDFLQEISVIDEKDIPEADEMTKETDEYGNVINNKDKKRNESTPDAYDIYLNMELAMPRGPDNSMEYAKVKRRVVDRDGVPIGVANQNPLLDTRQYEVEWYDGRTETLFANTIAENLFAQVDDDGNRHVLFHDITDHRKLDDALTEEEAYFKTSNGT